MARKPQTGGSKGKTTDPEQSARFIEAAREAGVDETGQAFEQAFQRITSKPLEASSRPSTRKQKRGGS